MPKGELSEWIDAPNLFQGAGEFVENGGVRWGEWLIPGQVKAYSVPETELF